VWEATAITAIGILGVIWGSNHPEKPFEDMYKAVSKVLTSWFGKNKHKEKSNDKKEDE